MDQVIHHLDMLRGILKGPNMKIGKGQLILGEDFINPFCFILVRTAIEAA